MPDWLDEPLACFVERIADETPAPGGGSTAAVVIAMGAALVEMAARFSRAWEGAADATARARGLRERALPLARRDAEAYEAVLLAARGPEGGREAELRTALGGASAVPLELAELGSDVAALAAAVVSSGKIGLRGDAAAGAVLAAAGARVAASLVAINLAGSAGDERVDRAEAWAVAAARSAAAAERAAARDGMKA
ncbi:MAG TPA: cyclodeaminase/cyclohydrolase family protein [Gaiellaceae bacterium]